MNSAFKIVNLFIVAHNLQQEKQFILQIISTYTNY